MILPLPRDYTKMDWRQRKQYREIYCKAQHDRCWWCGESLLGEARKDIKSKPIDRSKFPANFFKYPVHLHHNHDTGMTIGAVHNYCNAVLWQYHGE